MTITHVLNYPNFHKQFVLKTDACADGVGAILIQEKHPLVFYSYKISERMIGASVYIKETFAITQAVNKWSHYFFCK